jgi:prevent-host-death family protein
MHISVAEARNQLSVLLRRAQKQPVTITRHGQPAGVLVSPEEYERLRRVQAYLDVLRLSQSLHDAPTAGELLAASREELEGRR